MFRADEEVVDVAFVQIMEFTTSDIDAVRGIGEAFFASTEGRRTARRSIFLQDRGAPGRYLNVVFFDSAESAAENSGLPETQAFAAKLRAAVDGLTFRDCDVIEDRQG